MDVNLNENALPYGLRLIVENIGAEKAIQLLNEHGGQSFYIPLRPSNTHQTVKLFGLPLVQAWAEKYGASSYQVPMCNKLMMQVRDRVICSELEAKTSSKTQLATRFKITRQWVQKIYDDYLLEKRNPQQDWCPE
jgi:Mor family transcriptional regulator